MKIVVRPYINSAGNLILSVQTESMQYIDHGMSSLTNIWVSGAVSMSRAISNDDVDDLSYTERLHDLNN